MNDALIKKKKKEWQKSHPSLPNASWLQLKWSSYQINFSFSSKGSNSHPLLTNTAVKRRARASEISFGQLRADFPPKMSKGNIEITENFTEIY